MGNSSINAPNSILGTTDTLEPDNPIHQVFWFQSSIYINVDMCVDDKHSINGGLKYYKYCTCTKIKRNIILKVVAIWKRSCWLQFQCCTGKCLLRKNICFLSFVYVTLYMASISAFLEKKKKKENNENEQCNH